MDYKVCNSDELPNNSTKVVNVRGSDILVCRSNERLFAVDNCCPHRGASLSKSDIKGTKIICYMHYFEYDLCTGKLDKIPERLKRQSSGWKKSGDLENYKTFEDNHKNIFVEIPE